MTPIKFEGCNRLFGEGQTEYQPLPAAHLEDEQGTVLFCWKLTWKERLMVLLTGKVWHFVLTFNKPLQPQFLSTENPIAPIDDTP